MLVVDDNENARAVLTDMLESMSFKVDAVPSGADALAAVRKEAGSKPYEVVFLDWQMPGMDGLETARRIQGLELPAAPRQIMVTAYGREDVLKGAEAAGLDDVLIKPVSPSMLFDSVMRALGAVLEDAEGDSGAGPQATDELIKGLKGLHVLLAEDNDLNQQVAVELLNDAGVTVDVAENGAVAVEKARAGSYALVLMDMQMPVMDGITATRNLREAGYGLPIIAMTANAMQADRDRCAEAGMNDYLAKPIDPDEMFSVLAKWAKPAPKAEPDGIPEGVPGLDTALGLKRVRGKRPLYLDMLRKFSAGQRNAVLEVRKALAAGDAGTAERVAHTLKGTAGNIGAPGVQAEAAAVESAIRQGGDTVPLLATLEASLGSLVAHLDRHLPPPPEAEAPSGDAGEVLGRLRRLLEDSDPEAESLVTEHITLLRSLLPAQADPFVRFVKDFDFDRALALLPQEAAH
jgi:CheY-like chemotaxis protein/HPt (histidine-containing phosphotransfer) domain-containing protein